MWGKTPRKYHIGSRFVRGRIGGTAGGGRQRESLQSGALRGLPSPTRAANHLRQSATAPQRKAATSRRKEALVPEISSISGGDYLLPCIRLSDPPDAPPLGRYGRMHKEYLREHRPILYSRLVLSAASRLEAIGDREIANEVILEELVYT